MKKKRRGISYEFTFLKTVVIKKLLNFILAGAMVLCFAACSSPESDGKKAAEKFCDCEKQFVANQDKAAEKFIADFAGSNFQTRVTAREKSTHCKL